MASPANPAKSIRDFDLDFQMNFDERDKEARKKLLKSIQAIERSIISLVSKANERGADMNQQARLKQAMTMRDELAKVFKGFYKTSADVVSGYQESARDAVWFIDSVEVPTEFSTIDKEIVKSLSQISYGEFENLGREFQKTIGDQIYQGILTNRQLPDMIDSVSNALVGLEDKAGRPMTMYADQITHDEQLKFTRAFTTQKAASLGMTKYMYMGSLIDDSREFCVERAGKIFTTEEIQSWDELDWPGKNPDVPVMVSLGGYRCRHHLVPLDDDTANFMAERAASGEF